MFFNFAKFNQMKQAASEAGKTIKVTAKQLEEAFKASGMKASEIKMQLNIQKAAGGSVLVDNKLYELKKDKKKIKKGKK